jgi:hypothetical protein
MKCTGTPKKLVAIRFFHAPENSTPVIAVAHDRHTLRRRDVVAWLPVVKVGQIGSEIFSQEFLSPRESITPTHDRILPLSALGPAAEFTGHRLSIASKMRSAQRYRIINPGDRGWNPVVAFVLSKLSGCEDTGRDEQNALAAFVHVDRLALSLYIRHN